MCVCVRIKKIYTQLPPQFTSISWCSSIRLLYSLSLLRSCCFLSSQLARRFYFCIFIYLCIDSRQQQLGLDSKTTDSRLMLTLFVHSKLCYFKPNVYVCRLLIDFYSWANIINCLRCVDFRVLCFFFFVFRVFYREERSDFRINNWSIFLFYYYFSSYKYNIYEVSSVPILIF